MTPIDAYLTELRTALGDRLPPAVHTARLREARAHLLASADEVGEIEAVRRYGRARITANGLVRAHRRYDEKSSWALALPLAVSFTLFGTLAMTIAVRSMGHSHDPWALLLARGYVIVFFLAFITRVIQTRRWLVGPMLSAQTIGNLLALLIFELIHPAPLGASLGTDLLIAFVRAGVIWFTLNALALGLGRLFDWRPVRNVGSSR